MVNIINRIVSKKRYIILCLLFVSLISCIPLFYNGMGKGHDLTFHLSRIMGIKDNFELGIIGGYIYPKYFNGLGYGNPLFYPDIFLYIPAILHYIGVNVIVSYKIFIFLITLASSITMFISANGIFKNRKYALISSLIYTCSSYRIADAFARAALGESLAFVFAPLVIYGIYNIIYGDYKKIQPLIIGMSGLILSHVITTYIIGIILITICLVNINKFIKEPKRILYLFLAALITFLLTCYFLLPMLEQMLDRDFFIYNIDKTSNLQTMAVPIWAIFIETYWPGLVKEWIPSGIGLGIIFIIINFLKNFKKQTSFAKVIFILAIICLLVSTNLFPWNAFQKIFKFIQFPWRFYFVTTLLVSLGASSIVKIDKFNKYQLLLCAFLITLPIIINIFYKYEDTVTSYNYYSAAFGEYLPTNANLKFMYRYNNISSSHPINLDYERNGLQLNINFDDNSAKNYLEFPLLYYKGYTAFVNGKKIETYQTKHGLVGITLDDVESGTIEVGYTGTMIQKISRIISAMTLLTCTCIVMFKKKKTSH